MLVLLQPHNVIVIPRMRVWQSLATVRRPGMQLCDFEVGSDKPFFLIAGPCVVESEQMAMDVRSEEHTSELQSH